VASAMAEVLQGVYLVFELIFPARNFMFLILWWQYLQMRFHLHFHAYFKHFKLFHRFMLDKTGNLKTAFNVVDQRIVQLLTNRFNN